MADHNTLTHEFVSQIADDPNTALIRPSNWNHQHVFNGGSTDEYLRWNTNFSDNVEWDNIFSRLPFIDVTKAPYLAPTDGTDASSAINAAIVDLATTGGTVFLPGGTFGIGTAGIIFDTVNNIRLLGTNGTLLKSINTSSRNVSGGFGATSVIMYSCNRCVIENINFDPQGASLNHQNVGLDGCFYCEIKNCSFINAGKLAALCSVSGQYNRYISNRIYNGAASGTARGMWIGVTNGIESFAEIEGNIISTMKGHGISGTWTEAKCRGNRCYNNTGSGIVITADATGSNEGNIISSNLCTSNTQYGIEAGSSSTGRAYSTIVTGNYCSANTLGGIRGQGVVDFVVASNVCEGNGANGGTVAAGVDIQGGLGVLIDSNICRDLRSGASRGQYDGVALRISVGSDSAYVVKGNICTNNVRAGITAENTSTNTLKGLIVTGNICSFNDIGIRVVPNAVNIFTHVVVSHNAAFSNVTQDLLVGTIDKLTLTQVNMNAFDTPTVDTSYMLSSSLSKTNTPARNLSGQVSIADASTTGGVAFNRTEIDTSYNVLLGVEKGTGAPTLSAAYIDTKNAGGFNIRLVTAPGAGTSVLVNWMIVR